jgi:hypothetical protein
MPTIPLVDIQDEIGYAFISVTGKSSLSCHLKPSSAVILENGIPLPGPANALHDDIRRFGNGRYSFWKNRVYFSTPDNSDPRTNGRQYNIAYEQYSTPHARLLPRLILPVKRVGGALADLFALEKRRQVFWGTLYWICFVYVAWYRSWFVSTKRQLRNLVPNRSCR